MTTLHDPDTITLPEIERLRKEMLLIIREETVKAYIAGAKSILEKERK